MLPLLPLRRFFALDQLSLQEVIVVAFAFGGMADVPWNEVHISVIAPDASAFKR